MRVRPHSQAAKARDHHVSHLSPRDVFGHRQLAVTMASSGAGVRELAVSRRLAEGPPTVGENFTDMEHIGDYPSDEVPSPQYHLGAMMDWAGQKWWPGCYPGDADLHEMSVAILVDVKGWEKHSGNIHDHLTDMVTQASFIYEMQMHIRLQIGLLHIYETNNGAPPFAVGCPDINTKLTQLTNDNTIPFFAATHLMTGCGTDYGTVGLAYIGAFCTAYAKGVNEIHDSGSDSTFLIFAHELGHNLGAEHSFENGMGETGGIMDYGDGHVHGVYQFNSQFRQSQVCSTLSQQATTGCQGKFNLMVNPPPVQVTHHAEQCVTVGNAGLGGGHVCQFPYI